MIAVATGVDTCRLENIAPRGGREEQTAVQREATAAIEGADRGAKEAGEVVTSNDVAIGEWEVLVEKAASGGIIRSVVEVAAGEGETANAGASVTSAAAGKGAASIAVTTPYRDRMLACEEETPRQ